MSRHARARLPLRVRAKSALRHPGLVAPVVISAGILGCMSGSVTGAASASPVTGGPTNDSAVSESVAAALAARPGGTTKASAPAVSAAGLARTDAREQGQARAQRTLHERQAVAERQARAKAKARAAAKARQAKAAAAHRWVSPVANPVLTSSFGERWGRLHAGLDFGAVVGTPLRAMSTGVVTKAEWAGGYGQKVEIRYWDGTISYFAHMSELAVKAGQHVAPGTYVGKSGNTGHSTGPHLHLEIHPEGGDPIDPKPWLTARHVKF